MIIDVLLQGLDDEDQDVRLLLKEFKLWKFSNGKPLRFKIIKKEG